MKNKYFRSAAAFALAMIVACGALTGCTGTKTPTGSQKPPTTQSQQQKPDQQKPDKGQKPGQNKPGQQKPGQNKPGQQKPQENKPGQSEAKVEVGKIEKTATNKSVDTYTITFKDGNTTTFTVTYDADGKKISKIECAADKNGKAHVVEIKDGIWCIDGESTGIKAEDVRGANDANDNKKPDNKKPGNKKPGNNNSSGKKPAQKPGGKGSN